MSDGSVIGANSLVNKNIPINSIGGKPYENSWQKKMNLSIIILSRANSKRLPNKAFLKINNKMIIEYVIQVAKKNFRNSNIILSTSNNKSDNKLIDIAKKHKIQFFRGELENVYNRFYETMKFFELDYAVRLNGDSPLNSHHIIKKGLDIFVNNKNVDLITNIFPRTFPKGMSTEIIIRNCYKLLIKISDKYDLENITSFYKNEKV